MKHRLRPFVGFSFVQGCSLSMVAGWESSLFHVPRDESGRNRDVFPLPCLATEASVSKQVSRAVRRRVLKSEAIKGRVNMAVEALNSMWFGGRSKYQHSSVKDARTLPLCQREALEHIWQCVVKLGDPPADASSQGALSALRAPCSGYEEPIAGVGSVVDMDLGKLSLPSGAVAGVSLVDGLEGTVRDMVINYEDYLLRDADSWTNVEDKAGLLTPYDDPLLKHRQGYLQFLRHLFQRGILGYTHTCRGRVGAFTVSKKDKIVDGVAHARQRLVLDCRQTNLQFREPPLTELGSLSALAQLSLDPTEDLFVATADIRDCFYAADLPPGLSSFFCLRSDLTAEEASLVSNGTWSRLEPGRRISPCITVLPMGFNWSFYLIQCLHEQATIRSLGVSRSSLVLDGQPPPSLSSGSCIAMPYCDNVHSISTNKEVCQQGCDKICEELRQLGFELHEETPALTEVTTLGGVIDGRAGEVRASSTRMWRLIIAFQYMAHARVSTLLVQKLLGHAMTICVLNRSGMSIFRRLYDFIEAGGAPRYLKADERDECLNFAGLIPMLFADLRRSWSSTLTASDASPEGFGTVEQTVEPGEAKKLGMWNERWRFRRLPAEDWAPRKRALGRSILSDPSTVIGSDEFMQETDMYVDNDAFPEVPHHVLHPSLWKTKGMGRWRDTKEHITLKEGRACVLALRRLSRAKRHRDKNHVFFLDNLALVFAIHKGRAHSYDMLRITQQLASLSLVSRIGIRARWIPSELNPADAPSRGQICPGAFSKSSASGAEANPCPQPTWEDTAGKEDCQQNVQSWEGCARGRSGSQEGWGEEGAAFQAAVNASGQKDSKISASSEDTRWRRPEASWKFSKKSEDDSPGEEKYLDGVPQSVWPVPEQVQGLLTGERGPLAYARGACRHLHGRFPRLPLQRGALGTRRRKGDCSNGVRIHQTQREASSKSSSPARLAQSQPINQQIAVTKTDDVWNGDGHESTGLARHGTDDHGGLHVVPSSRGGVGTMQTPHCPPSEDGGKPIWLGQCGDQGPRGSKARQGGRVRQQLALRCGQGQMDRRSLAATLKQVGQELGSAFLVQHGRLSQEVPTGRLQTGCRSPTPVPTSARGSHRRHDFKEERLRWSQEPWEVENRPVSETVCKSGTSTTTPSEAARLKQEVLPLERAQHEKGHEWIGHCQNHRDVREVDVFTVHGKPHTFALELFAGCARLSQACCDQGLPCYPIDICLFPSHNVLLSEIESKIVFWMKTGRVKMIWAGMPCTTFSRARKFDGLGPGPLRTDEYLWGLPLNARDRRKVHEGNQLLAFLLLVLQVCEQYSIPYVVENPLSSMLWMMPSMVKFCKKFSPTFVSLDYCAYGESWKKPTTLMYNFLDLQSLGVRCNTSGHMCSFSNKAHTVLRGTNAAGVFLTLVAQPYPKALVAAVARLARAQCG